MLAASTRSNCCSGRRTRTSAPASRARVLAPSRRPIVAANALNATVVSEIALGGTATLAALTFGVAPRFRELFKEDVDWKQIHAELTQETGGALEDVSVEELARLLAAEQSSLVVLDVRPATDFARAHAPGAINVPMYMPIQGWGAPAIIRRAAFAFFGIAGTEPNPDFDAAALDAIRNKRRALVVCATGGSLAPKQGAAWGFSSRSLKAVWRLRRASGGAGGGAPRLAHVRGGMREYRRGAGDDGQVGLAGLVTVGDEGDWAPGEDAAALAAMREALGVKKAAGGGVGAAGERAGSSPAQAVEGALAAVRGLFGAR